MCNDLEEQPSLKLTDQVREELKASGFVVENVA